MGNDGLHMMSNLMIRGLLYRHDKDWSKRLW